MKKPRNRYKTRRPAKPRKSAKRKPSQPSVGRPSCPSPTSSPSSPTSVGRASCPSPTPSPPSDDHLIESLLRLWERDDLTLGDIADHLGLSLRALLTLIEHPEVDALLTRIEALHERRTRQTALAKSRRALITLEQVQTEAEADAQATPITPQATKAQRDARSNRNQRRLAATATLNQLRVLKVPVRKVGVPDQSTQPQRARAA